jgi:hypothetical protein
LDLAIVSRQGSGYVTVACEFVVKKSVFGIDIEALWLIAHEIHPFVVRINS